ncbi:MFS transporter [Actinocorallia sp. A-T 12471]|uniref:MFS transporter n=1 Tax=Actinocorallia sp. A-T 12471 TaxID=3089813 RepID=UPI0029D35EEC|nr:MFS transporter [Actinocorallia sp. A-T 12471]MDX6741065.1 MFS transporter [Actinocorallia sp. A-T 12471]
MPTITQRRFALYALFFVPGLSIASWVTRTPAIRDHLAASTAQMGLILVGLSIGSMIGILGSGPLVARFGARTVIVGGTLGIIVAVPAVGLGAALSAGWLVTLGLFLFGLGMGCGEVAMNVEGADVEREIDRPVLPVLHGCFSLGTVVGALAGIGFTAVEFPVVWHLALVGAAALAVFAFAIPRIPDGTGRTRHDGQGEVVRGPAPWRDSRLLLIGGVILAMALAEGAANDWLPLLMVDGHGLDPALGSAVYTVFAAAMTVGRFAGVPVLRRWGRVKVLAASALSAIAGLGIVAGTDHQLLAGAAVILWGLGAALGFPVALSAAGDSGPDAAARVALVSIIGYVAFLAGPPVLGFLGETVGLRGAMLVPLGFLAVAVFLTPAAGDRRSPVGAGG